MCASAGNLLAQHAKHHTSRLVGAPLQGFTHVAPTPSPLAVATPIVQQHSLVGVTKPGATGKLPTDYLQYTWASRCTPLERIRQFNTSPNGPA